MSAETKNLKAVTPKLSIYYVILAVITVLVLALSFVSYYIFPAMGVAGFDLAASNEIAESLAISERNIYTEYAVLENRTAYTVGLNTIKAELDNMAGVSAAPSSRASATIDKTNASQKITAALSSSKATYTVMDFAQADIDYTIDSQTVRAMRISADNTASEDIIVASRQVKNIIVEIPGSGDDAVLFMTHYDSAEGSKGAMGAASTAAMLGVINDIVSSGKTYTNDLVFVFTEGRYENSVGAYAFYNQFVGFDNVASKIKVAFNFDALTAGGSLSIVQAAESYGGVFATAQNASRAKTGYQISEIVDDFIKSDVDIFYNYEDEEWAVPAVNFMMTGGTYDAGSYYDNPEYVDMASAVSQYAGAMSGLAGAFGDAALDYAPGLDGSAMSFYGLDFGVSGIVLIILASLALLALIVYFIFGIKSKEVNFRDAAKGTATVLAASVIAAGVAYGAYFLISLLTVAVGSFTLEQIFSGIIMTPALVIPAMLLGVGVSCGCYSLFKRMLYVKSKDCVKGVSVLLTIAGFVLAFAYPRLSLTFILSGLLLTIVNFITLLLKKSNAKKGVSYPLGKLFLSYVVAIIFFGPFIELSLLISNTFGSIFLPLMILPLTALLSTITPYFTKLAPVLEDAFEKLPKHTVRVQKEITTTVEDPVKKGKFQEVTEVKVVNEKVAWKYSNGLGVTIITLIAVIALAICSIVVSYTTPIGQNVTGDLSFLNSGIEKTFYDDAVVFYKEASSTGSYKLKIKDTVLYSRLKHFDAELTEYDYWNWTYDDEAKEYSRTISASNPVASGACVSSVEGSDGEYQITPFYGATSQIVLKVRKLAAGTTITIIKDDETAFTYKAANPATDVVLTLPYGYGNAILKVESEEKVEIKAYEYITNENAINNDGKEKLEDIKAFFNSEGVDIKFSYVIVTEA